MTIFRLYVPKALLLAVPAALAVLVAIAASNFGNNSQAYGNEKFVAFIENFYETAKQQGITRQTFDAAFKGITKPNLQVIRSANSQPEFTNTLWQYLDSRVDEYAIFEGRKHKAAMQDILAKLEQKYGVSQNILLAIWSMESSYGKTLKKYEMPIIHSLATLAFLDKKRSGFAKKQLIAALKILQNNQNLPRVLYGSWAGAMGHTQFIPTSYLAYAEDGDGDGFADIWRAPSDALATAANLLKQNGWREGESWGYEIEPTKNINHLQGETKTIEQWQQLGIKRVRGKQFEKVGRNAILFYPSGKEGPAFLLLRNFYILKTYNNADKYALAVGHLADRIGGEKTFATSLPRPFTKLTLLEKIELQKQLSKQGFYAGEIDGKIGPKSRQAIIEAQKKLNLEQNGYASKKLLAKLKGK